VRAVLQHVPLPLVDERLGRSAGKLAGQGNRPGTGELPARAGVRGLAGPAGLRPHRLHRAYLGSAAVVDIAVVSAQTIRASGGALRTGLALLLVACAFALAYLGGKVVGTIHDLLVAEPIAVACRGPFADLDCALSVGFPAVSVLLIVLGLSVPAIPGAVRAFYDARTGRALRPLRTHLTRRFPDIVRLDPAGTTTRQRLLTAMSETNDGLILAGVIPSMSADTAAELVHAAPASAVEQPT
jgi:hypothetical protein